MNRRSERLPPSGLCTNAGRRSCTDAMRSPATSEQGHGFGGDGDAADADDVTVGIEAQQACVASSAAAGCSATIVNLLGGVLVAGG